MRVFIVHGAGALAAAMMLAGCVTRSEREDDAPVPEGLFAAGVADGAADSAALHEGAWTWEELSVRAGRRADRARIASIDAAVGRQKVADELAWKNPELRMGWGLDDQRDREQGRRPANGDGYRATLGVRFYVPNPFVNRYVRARGEAEERGGAARMALESYKVYSEVKMLCCEEARAGDELKALTRQRDLLDELRRREEEVYQSGVSVSPLDVLRAETKWRKTVRACEALAAARAALRRQIAWLADVPEAGFEIAAEPPILPAAEELSLATLVEVAFARRPDLAVALAELDAAEANVGAAKAALLPWFRFVEAAYEHANDRSDDNGRHETGHEDEWTLKAALNLPVFAWTGESVKLSSMVRDRADARVQALYASIRMEIEVALADYREASAQVREDEARAFVRDMERRIADYAAAPTADAAEICRARAELQDWESVQAVARRARVEAALRLESVIGGPLP